MVLTRSKRPLAETDPNARPSPAKFAKKNDNSTPKKPGKELASLEDSCSRFEEQNKKKHEPSEDTPLDSLEEDDSSRYDESSDSEQSDDEAIPETTKDDRQFTPVEDQDPYEYICMVRYVDDRIKEELLKPEKERRTREQIRKEHNAAVKKCKYFDQPASEHPDHKWVIMRKSFMILGERINESGYCVPDAYGMCIWNDWEGFGLTEIAENFIVAFKKEFQKPRQNYHMRDMWIHISAFIHWDNQKRNGISYNCISECDQEWGMLDLISRAFLTILNILERASQLKPKSDFKDLALVMALYLQWSQQYIEHQGYDDEDVFPCAPQIIRYAANHDIDLVNSGVSGMQQLLEEKKEAVENQNPWPKDAIDRWGFKKAFAEHERKFGGSGISMRPSNGKLGGHKYDVTKMPKEMRQRYAFDGKDPFADLTEKELQENRLDGVRALGG